MTGMRHCLGDSAGPDMDPPFLPLAKEGRPMIGMRYFLGDSTGPIIKAGVTGLVPELKRPDQHIPDENDPAGDH